MNGSLKPIAATFLAAEVTSRTISIIHSPSRHTSWPLGGVPVTWAAAEATAGKVGVQEAGRRLHPQSS